MRVLFFAHLKDTTHCAEMTLACDDVDAAGLWRELIAVHPGLGKFRASVWLAKKIPNTLRRAPVLALPMKWP
jgi:hypothetical protein